jgi:hypothetical protein
MSSDSWAVFVDALRVEAELLASLEASSAELTKALVAHDLARIGAVNDRMERDRLAHQNASKQRQAMQRRGFGTMPLRQVAAHAPRPLAMRVRGYCSELTYRAISLGITTQNNKQLILAGMDRLLKVVSLLQHAVAEQPGTYRRRGRMAPPENSVLVSSKA